MFRKLTFLFLVWISLVAFAGCSVYAANVLPVEVTESPGLDEPVDSEYPAGEPAVVEDWQLQPGDENLGRGEVEIYSTEIYTLESFPPQFMLHVTGQKGNPCNLLRAEIGEPDTQNHINVDVYVLFDPAALCMAVVEDFEVNLPLGSLDAGQYTVFVNGQPVGEIVAP